MKEAKFRAWDGTKMIYDVLPFAWDAVIKKGFHECLIGSDGAVRPFHDAEFRVQVSMIDNVIVEQWSGLKDKNREEIYDGDIILWHKKHYIIKWNQLHCCFGIYENNTFRGELIGNAFPELASFPDTEYEVIGNIHLNLDLIK